MFSTEDAKVYQLSDEIKERFVRVANGRSPCDGCQKSFAGCQDRCEIFRLYFRDKVEGWGLENMYYKRPQFLTEFLAQMSDRLMKTGLYFQY